MNVELFAIKLFFHFEVFIIRLINFKAVIFIFVFKLTDQIFFDNYIFVFRINLIINDIEFRFVLKELFDDSNCQLQ